jgi:hypothetical protein
VQRRRSRARRGSPDPAVGGLGWSRHEETPRRRPRSARVSRPRRRLLLGWSRHEETPRRRLIEWTADGGDYQVLAETSDGEFDRGWSALRGVLSEVEGPQTAAAILRHWPADSPPPSRATLHRWLARAVQRQWLCWEASNRRNAPYHYWLPPTKES